MKKIEPITTIMLLSTDDLAASLTLLTVKINEIIAVVNTLVEE